MTEKEMEIFGFIPEEQDKVGEQGVDQFSGRARPWDSVLHGSLTTTQGRTQSCFLSVDVIGTRVCELQSVRSIRGVDNTDFNNASATPSRTCESSPISLA